MKKLFFFNLLISFLLLFAYAFPGIALDEAGCLTCHQYPGLVVSEKTGAHKVLHIDEQKFLASAHGKLSCKTCHPTIDRVPHTEQKKVECTSECHQSEKDKRLIKKLKSSDFHKKEQSHIARLDEESSCRVCHPLYPHYENVLVSAFLNMHTGFMHCEVCHYKREKLSATFHKWISDRVEFSGTPYGTYFNPEKKEADRAENTISRIALFTRHTGKEEMIVNTVDIKKASDFLLKDAHYTSDEHQNELTYFHRDIDRKEVSVACNECHSEKSIMDFQALGFNETKIENLTLMNLKGLVTHYKIFFLPNLFGK